MNAGKLDANAIDLVKIVPMIEACHMAADAWKRVKPSTISNVFKKLWGTEECKTRLDNFDVLSEVPCPPQMDRETFLSQVDLEAPFQAEMEQEANDYEANKEDEANEINDTVTEPEAVHSLAESLLAISKIRTHLMALGEDQETFESLQSVERIFIKKSLEQSNSKQTKLTNYFNVNQLTLK